MVQKSPAVLLCTFILAVGLALLDSGRFASSNEIQIYWTYYDTDPNESFGVSLYLSDPYQVVGAGDCWGDCPDGAVLVYSRDGIIFNHEATLTPTSPNTGFFGGAVAAFGNRIIVGDSQDNGNRGMAYIYERQDDNWVLVATIVPDNVEEGDYFGTSVAIGEDIILVGAPGSSRHNCEECGGAYVYTYDGDAWVQSQFIQPEGIQDSGFGSQVYISQGFAVVSAPFHDTDGYTDNGAVWAYQIRRNKYFQPFGVLYSDFNDSNMYFGETITMLNGLFVVGDDNGNGFSFAVSKTGFTLVDIFDLDWMDTTIVSESAGFRSFAYPWEYSNSGYVHNYYLPSGAFPSVQVTTGPTRNRGFGTATIFHDDRLIIAQPFCIDPKGLCDGGRVYHLEQFDGKWAISNSLRYAGQNGDAQFGISLAVLDDLLIVGSGQSLYGPFNTGAVQLFYYDNDSNHYYKVVSLRSRIYQLDASFGTTVTGYDNVIVVGAPTFHHDPENTESGIVFVYRVKEDGTWGRNPVTIESSEYYGGERFGYSVSLCSGYLAIGNNPYDTNDGYIYIYVDTGIDGWQQFGGLYYDGNGFGRNVIATPFMLIAGVPEDDGHSYYGTPNGAVVIVYVNEGEFDDDDWLRDSIYMPGFGSSIAYWNNNLIVGTDPCATGNPAAQGRAYLFSFHVQDEFWYLRYVYAHGVTSGSDRFGAAVSTSGNYAVVAAPQSDFGGEGRGAAWIFSLDITAYYN